MHEFAETRVLAAPHVCYLGARMIPLNGVWDSFGAGAKFLKSVRIEKWGIFYTCKGFRGKDLTQAQHNFVQKLIAKGQSTNVQFDRPSVVLDLSRDLREMKDNIENARKNIRILTSCFKTDFQGCDFVLVVIPKKLCEMYIHAKQAAELSVGQLTQCVVSHNFDPKDPKRTDSIVGSIILKVNSKLGGINHTVLNSPSTRAFQIFEEPVIIIGVDVTHPPPNIHKSDEEMLSFAAVTCSINKSGMPYMMHVQAQRKAGKGAAEIIENFDLIIKKGFLGFKAKTELQPRKIIYYSDGVGEGQFPEILHNEMRSIRRACSTLNATYQPRITFVTVQKRHKIRIFMQGGRVDNAPPGTVVDTDIVHPTENDFFLLSHQGIRGSTARPTRYHVLWDDSDFSADEIQQLTYYLCYMYVRCNRSVSIPAPTYYAHRAAATAKVLAQDLEGSVAQINEKLLRTEINSRSPMHFVKERFKDPLQFF